MEFLKENLEDTQSAFYDTDYIASPETNNLQNSLFLRHDLSRIFDSMVNDHDSVPTKQQLHENYARSGNENPSYIPYRANVDGLHIYPTDRTYSMKGPTETLGPNWEDQKTLYHQTLPEPKESHDYDGRMI